MKLRSALVASLILAFGLTGTAAGTSVLFLGNSFLFGSGSAVRFYRADSVTDLSDEGIGGNDHASTYGYYPEALVIFGHVTGRDPRSLGQSECSAYELGLSRSEAKALQQVAFDQLANTGEVTAAPLELPTRSIRSAVSPDASVCPNQP